MNKKQQKSRSKKIATNTLEMRQQLWPTIENKDLWIRTERKGFTTLPRTMPLITRIIDDLSTKGAPVSSTYLSLWCRVHDEGLVNIGNESELAFEAGFGGERRIATWKSRMRKLDELGFIQVQSGAKGEFNYVLIVNPYHVIKKFKADSRVQNESYNALFGRAQEIGATDLK